MAYRDDISSSSGTPLDDEAPARSQPAAFSPGADHVETPLGGEAEIPSAPADKRRSSRKRLVIAAVLLAVVAGSGYEGYGWWTNGRFMVSTDDAYVQADITILAAKASGYVASVEVENNARVEAGQVIARLDDVDYRLAVQAAQDKLATQQSAITRIGRQIEAAEAATTQADAQIAAARADAERSVADYQRQLQLSQSDFASRARLEQAKADRDRAAANVKGAEASLVAARANVAVLKAQQGEAERLASEYRTALARAERDLSFTVIRAPVAGVLGNRAVEVGAYVQPGTRLGALVPLSSVHVDANFKETQLASIRPGETVEIEVDAFGGRHFSGRVESVAPASGATFSLLPPENATGNFTKIVQRVPVKITLKDEDLKALSGRLVPGMSVIAEVELGEQAPARVDTRTAPTKSASR
jgi:membrane fusion protein (multidrug efflux system)